MTNQIVRPKRMVDNEEQPLLWSDIKTFCDGLTKDELQQNVKVWGYEKGGGIYSIAVITEDLVNPTGDSIETISAYDDLEDEPIVMPKGTIVMELDF
jgi:hypothetical protein